MAIKAYVLIVTDPGNTKHVFEHIHGMEGIQEVHEVMGPYDIVVEISADNLQEIPRIRLVLGERNQIMEQAGCMGIIDSFQFKMVHADWMKVAGSLAKTHRLLVLVCSFSEI